MQLLVGGVPRVEKLDRTQHRRRGGERLVLLPALDAQRDRLVALHGAHDLDPLLQHTGTRVQDAVECTKHGSHAGPQRVVAVGRHGQRGPRRHDAVQEGSRAGIAAARRRAGRKSGAAGFAQHWQWQRELLHSVQLALCPNV